MRSVLKVIAIVVMVATASMTPSEAKAQMTWGEFLAFIGIVIVAGIGGGGGAAGYRIFTGEREIFVEWKPILTSGRKISTTLWRGCGNKKRILEG